MWTLLSIEECTEDALLNCILNKNEYNVLSNKLFYNVIIDYIFFLPPHCVFSSSHL